MNELVPDECGSGGGLAKMEVGGSGMVRWGGRKHGSEADAGKW